MSPRSYTMQRRSRHVAQTRERILDAALELFSKQGAQATTMTWSQRDMHCSIELAPRLEAAGWRRVAETPRMRSTC